MLHTHASATAHGTIERGAPLICRGDDDDNGICACVCRSRISAFVLSFSLFFLLIFSRYLLHEHTSSIMGQAKSKENRVLSRKTHCKQPSFLRLPPPVSSIH